MMPRQRCSMAALKLQSSTAAITFICHINHEVYMVKETVGRLFKNLNKGHLRYFVYLPKNLVEDSAFPFKIESSMPVKITFNEKQIIIEKT